LAESALAEAERIVTEKQLLYERVREIEIAMQHREQSRFNRAIEHYKQAWKHAKSVTGNKE
jgi:hypothetical protein